MKTVFTTFVALSLAGVLRGSDAADIGWVTVGDPGNPADATGFGAVPYVFQIAKHEVSNEQYVEFLNAVAKSDPHGLWSDSMGEPLLRDNGQGGIQENLPVFAERTGPPGAYHYACRAGWEKKPVVYVTFLSAMRFANWRHHGGGNGGTENGGTENGAYDLAKGGLAPREAGARVWIPSENEWYKAAYYQPASQGGPAGGYWRYATRSNDQPTAAAPGSELANAAIFGHQHQFRLLAPVGSVPAPCAARVLTAARVLPPKIQSSRLVAWHAAAARKHAPAQAGVSSGEISELLDASAFDWRRFDWAVGNTSRSGGGGRPSVTSQLSKRTCGVGAP